jgi:N utilization substance protein B
MKAPTQAHQARSVARLAAVQALYQMEVSGVGSEAVVREFVDHRFDADMEGERLAPADEAYFSDIVRGVIGRQSDIDRAILKRLAEGWKLERIDATLRAILRAGAFELIGRPDAPTEVVINEYVEIAKSFFEGPEPGVANAVLDAIARDERA